jgi:hypothetical protein
MNTDTAPINYTTRYNQPFLKVCKSCGIEKPIDLFRNRKDSIDGKRNECKKCLAEKHKIWKKQNPEIVKKNNKIYQQKHREQINKRAAIYYHKPDAKIWKKKFPEKAKEIVNNWRKNNREKVAKWDIEWRNKNKEKVNEYGKKHRAKSINEADSEYITRQLIKKGFLKNDITEELINVQQIIIKTKRLCKTLQNSEQV